MESVSTESFVPVMHLGESICETVFVLLNN